MPCALNQKNAVSVQDRLGKKKSLLTPHRHVLVQDLLALEDGGNFGYFLLFGQFGHIHQIWLNK